jgi:hypothetical protein
MHFFQGLETLAIPVGDIRRTHQGTKKPPASRYRRPQMPPQGLEPVPSSPQKTPLLKQGGAESGALFGDDARLRVLLVAWAELPESVKTAVMEMVRG